MVDVSTIEKIEVGDDIEIRATVVDISRSRVYAIKCALPGAGGVTFNVDNASVTAHHPKPKPLGVGDRVRDIYGNVAEVAAPKRSAGKVEEYALWLPEEGYVVHASRDVESWERVS
jgi:hypothetical protein